MTNQEKIAVYKRLSGKIAELHAERKWEERNTFVPQLWAIYLEIDWGFREGDRVMIYEGKRKVSAKVIRHQDDNYYHVRKDEGGEVVLPGTWLHPFQTEVPQPVEPEQMSLF